MSKLTREEAKELMWKDNGFGLHSLCHGFELIDELFDQHEDETAQLRMENNELQERIDWLKKENKRLEIAQYRYKDRRLPEASRELKSVQEQLCGEVVAEFESEPSNFSNEAYTFSEIDFDTEYKVLVIKQKGE